MSETCTVEVLWGNTHAALQALHFDTVVDEDILTVNGVSFSGLMGPTGKSVSMGDIITWETSNTSDTSSGCVVCLDDSFRFSPYFKLTSGECKVEQNCIFSENYPSNYDGEDCFMAPMLNGTLGVLWFEMNNDALYVDGVGYARGTGPDGVSVVAGNAGVG